MGREATCHCKWGDEQGDCKVLLEGAELILRLGIRRRVPVSSLTGVSAVGENLVFRAGQDRVQLRLGREVAERWLKAITTPLPSLAAKLGISSTTRLMVLGDVQSEELKAAIAEAGSVGGKEVDLVLICVNSQSELSPALRQCFEDETRSAPLWIVYPKGAGQRGQGIGSQRASPSPRIYRYQSSVGIGKAYRASLREAKGRAAIECRWAFAGCGKTRWMKGTGFSPSI